MTRNFTSQHRWIGTAAAWAVCLLGVAYAVTTMLGFFSLDSPQDAIGDPFFSIMELLIILIAPFMVMSMVAVYAYAAPDQKGYSLGALIFMSLLAGITSSVHFVILTVGRSIAAPPLDWVPLLFSFRWPSVVYALDILAWDWFFALAMFLSAPVFQKNKLERTIQILMRMSGVLCLAGLIGVPLADMQLRNVGIIGYGVLAPVIFLLLGIVFYQQNALEKAG